MKTLILAALLTMGSATAVFGQGRFYVGGSWGYNSPGPVRVYGAPPAAPAYGYGSYGYARRPLMPGPGYVWIDGYYDYVGRGYRWHAGYWARRPHPRANWVRPRYNRGEFYAGYWRR